MICRRPPHRSRNSISSLFRVTAQAILLPPNATAGTGRPNNGIADRFTEFQMPFQIVHLVAKCDAIPPPRCKNCVTGDSSPSGSTSSIKGSVLFRPSKKRDPNFLQWIEKDFPVPTRSQRLRERPAAVWYRFSPRNREVVQLQIFGRRRSALSVLSLLLALSQQRRWPRASGTYFLRLLGFYF